MKSLLFLVIAFFGMLEVANGQNESNTQFVYLFSNEKIDANQVIVKTNIFGKSTFTVDDVVYNPQEIKFYQSDKRFYANMKQYSVLGKSTFIRRIEFGNINLYNPLETNSPLGMNPLVGVTAPISSSTGPKIKYYNKGFDDLRKTKLKNLKVDLKDNPTSLAYVHKTQKLDILAAGLATVGLGAFVVAVSENFSFAPSGGVEMLGCLLLQELHLV